MTGLGNLSGLNDPAMTGRERIARAMHHQQPDRVPVMCQLALGHYFLNAGLPPHRIWFTSEGFAEALVKLQRRYRFDGILINLPGRPANLLESGTFTMCHGWQTSSGPARCARYPITFFRTIERVKAQVGDEVSIHGEVFSPFTHYMELLGYEQALIGLATDPGKVHALLDRLTEASVTWAAAQARRRLDAVLISSAFAGGSFISRKMYSEFVVPYERRVAEAVTAEGVPVYTHTCGKIGDRLELMAETGTQGIDTLDPPPLGNVELAEGKRRIGDRLFIKGNLNPVALLAYRTKEEVITEASRCLRDGAPGGGYILSSACSVSPRVEPWKLGLLTELAEGCRYD